MMRFRNSQLRLRRQCGFAYAMAYKRTVPASPSPALDGGTNIHRAAQLLVRRIVEGGPIDVHDIAFRTLRGGSSEYADGLWVLTRLQEAIGVEFDVDPKAVIVLEEELAMPITLPDGTVVEFFGTPDLVQKTGRGTCAIDDYKTQWMPEAPEDFRADQQLDRYALLVHHHFPTMQTFRLTKRFVRWENSFVEKTLTADDLRGVELALASEIAATLELDRAGDYQATPGEWCALCQVHALCPRIREFLDADRDIDVPSIEDDDHARSLAADAHALEQASDRIKARLKRYLGGEHPKGYVPLPGGGYYGYGPRNHRDVDYAQLVAVLEECSIEADAKLANTNLKAFDRLMKRLPESARKRVECVVQHSQSSDFRYRKNDPSKATAPAATEPEELFAL